MSVLKIEWLSDTTDCETCGVSYADGAIVSLDDNIILELEPAASCTGPVSWTEIEVFQEILKYLGYTMEERYES